MTSATNPNTPKQRAAKTATRKPVSPWLVRLAVLALLWLYGWGGGDWNFGLAGGWTAPLAYLTMMVTFCYVRGRYRMLRAQWARTLRYYDPR